MFKVGLIGCGRIGAMHAANLAAHDRLELSVVFDVHTPAAEAVAARHGARTAASVDEALGEGDGGLDAVLIASATDTHADLLERAVGAGKAVFCEKPVDISLARVDRCAAAIRGCERAVQLGFNRRFDPGHRAARDAARAGEIGDLHQVIITSRDPEIPPRAYLEAAGGLLRDMTIHDFDLARFMLDDEPAEVFAIADALIDPALGAEIGEVDTAMIVMRTADGKMCCVNNSRTAVYGYDQRVELLGRTGMLISGNRRPHELSRYGASATESAPPYLHSFADRYAEAFARQLDAFADALETGDPPEVGFEDGRRALVLAEAAYRSLAERRMVRVEEIGGGA